MSRTYFWSSVSLAATLLLPAQVSADIQAPAGSVGFGASTLVLPNRNIAVSAPQTPGQGGELSVGAVYLYTPEGVLISELRGSQAGDAIGSRGFTVAPDGDGFFVHSPLWSNGAASAAGALTWVDADTGLSGVVGPDNSIVGSSQGDSVGGIELVPLADGRFAIHAPVWNNGSVNDAGAVRVFDPDAPTFGAITPANALVGSSNLDRIGQFFFPLFGIEFSTLTPLPDGGLIFRSPFWNRGALNDAGAITYIAPGATPAGVLSASNSLVGSSAADFVGAPLEGPLLALPDGAWMVRAPDWDGPAGANQGAVVRFASPADLLGEISPQIALTGAQAEDRVGDAGLTLLTNGAVLVASPNWKNGTLAQAGALTWIAPGASMAGETVGPGNSLFGTQANDRVSSFGVTVLASGHAVVASPNWANGDQASAGAVTWINADTGLTGAVSSANSLVGSVASSQVGNLGGSLSVSGVVALPNGHYLVRSGLWRPSPEVGNAGAVTWGDGTVGRVGVVDATNSLVGQRSGDRVGGFGDVRLLADSDALVHSAQWNDAQGSPVGAVTWVSGTGSTVGVLDAQNSWVGTTSGDLSAVGMHAFEDGSALLTAFNWNNGAGAVIGIPAGGSAGVVGPANSQVGQAGDRLGEGVGQGTVVELGDGSVLVSSPNRRVLGTAGVGSLHRVGAGESPVGNFVDADAFTGVADSDAFGSSGIGTVASPDGEGFFVISEWLTSPNGGIRRGGMTVWRSNDPSGQMVGADNTLFGESELDFLNARLIPLPRGTHLLILPGWDSLGVLDAGRLIWFDSTAVPGGALDANAGRFGVIDNDVPGGAGVNQIDWNAERMVIGMPRSNRVIFLPLSSGTLFANGFEGD